MKLKTYLKIIGYIAIYVICLGFLCPFLISYPNDAAVVLGFAVIAALIFLTIKLIINFFKKFNK